MPNIVDDGLARAAAPALPFSRGLANSGAPVCRNIARAAHLLRNATTDQHERPVFNAVR